METFKNFIQKFTPYLEDIRKRLYFVAVFFVVAFVGGFISTRWIIKVIIQLFDLENVIIATTSPFQFADLSVNIGLSAALLLTGPLIVYHVFAFLRPAMNKKERFSFIFLIPISALLFVLGFVYGFFILYFALFTLAKINESIGIKNIWDIGSFLSEIIVTATFLGLLFEFPIVCTYFIRLGLVDVDFLRKKRRIAVFVMFIASTLLPPTDGLSLVAMVLPLILLYEITIFVNSRVCRSM